MITYLARLQDITINNGTIPRFWKKSHSFSYSQRSSIYCFVSIVLFHVLFVCKFVLLPLGVNPIAVKYISYHIILSYYTVWTRFQFVVFITHSMKAFPFYCVLNRLYEPVLIFAVFWA
jgi:hypothetical protein